MHVWYKIWYKYIRHDLIITNGSYDVIGAYWLKRQNDTRNGNLPCSASVRKGRRQRLQPFDQARFVFVKLWHCFWCFWDLFLSHLTKNLASLIHMRPTLCCLKWRCCLLPVVLPLGDLVGQVQLPQRHQRVVEWIPFKCPTVQVCPKCATEIFLGVRNGCPRDFSKDPNKFRAR